MANFVHINYSLLIELLALRTSKAVLTGTTLVYALCVCELFLKSFKTVYIDSVIVLKTFISKAKQLFFIVSLAYKTYLNLITKNYRYFYYDIYYVLESEKIVRWLIFS